MTRADLSAIEIELAHSTPFASSTYIAGKVSAAYAHLLAVLAEHGGGAASALRALGRTDEASVGAVFRDPLVRRTVEDGVLAGVLGVDVIDAVLLEQVLTAMAEDGFPAGRTLLDSAGTCAPLDQPAERIHVWLDEAPGTPLGRRFVDEVGKRLPGFRSHVPTPQQLQTLRAGKILASRVAPELARSALSHVFLIVVGSFADGERPFGALTTPGLPGVLFVSPGALTGSADVAETLVHEAMHLKFLDLEYASSLFAPGFRPESSPRTTPPWHEGKPGFGDWPVDRVLTSMHVYLTLAVYFSLIGAGGASGVVPEPDAYRERAAGCVARSAWLSGAARQHADLLSETGREFVAFVGGLREDLETVVFGAAR